MTMQVKWSSIKREPRSYRRLKVEQFTKRMKILLYRFLILAMTISKGWLTMLKRVKAVGSVGDFLSGAHKYKDIERKINKKLLKTGMKVAVTVVAGGLMLNVTMPSAFAMSPEVIQV